MVETSSAEWKRSWSTASLNDDEVTHPQKVACACHATIIPSFHDSEYSAPRDRVMASHSASPFFPLDQQRFNRFHTLALFTTGMGVFADGYDLSSIAVVLGFALHSFGVSRLTGIWSSLMTGSALAGAVVGALIFGWLANHGRKRFYGLDVTILAVAALAQAFVPSMAWLLVVRFVLGFGTGADYVLSPIILGEHINARDRGKALAIGFGILWVLGAAASAVVYIELQALGTAPGLVWRVVLAAGAIPAASVIYLRRKLPETPRFLGRIRGDQAALEATTAKAGVRSAVLGVEVDRTPMRSYLQRHWRTFAVACLLWFLYDIVVYAGILFGPALLARRAGLDPGTFQLINVLVFTIPGGVVGALLSDRMGRKPLQAIGFAGMALMLFGYGLYSGPGLTPASGVGALTGIIFFGLYNFFSQGGPGSVSATGLLGVELVPTKVRGLVQGLTVAAGRIGAMLTAFVFPALFHAYGAGFAMNFLVIICLIAALLTVVGIPETKRQSLEQTSREFPIPDLQPDQA